jgi:hypothetical protein
LGAQLRQLGVPTLLIDSRKRPSDTWRDRHDSLSLHSPSYFDQMPEFSYPANWPLHPSKDQFANWLDAYRSVMDLYVWTSAKSVAVGDVPADRAAIEAEVVELLGPVRVRIAHALDIDAARQAPLDGCLDQLRGNKRERECEIDLAQGASLSFRKLLGVSD